MPYYLFFPWPTPYLTPIDTVSVNTRAITHYMYEDILCQYMSYISLHQCLPKSGLSPWFYVLPTLPHLADVQPIVKNNYEAINRKKLLLLFLS